MPFSFLCKRCFYLHIFVCSSIKVSVHHFRKIGGCLEGHYFLSLLLVFIFLRCHEPEGLTNNLAQNRNIYNIFENQFFFFFLNALTLGMKIYINKYSASQFNLEYFDLLIYIILTNIVEILF